MASASYFIRELEKQVEESIVLMLQRRERITYPHPNESTTLTVPYSQSTEESSASSGTIKAPTSQRVPFGILQSEDTLEKEQRVERIDTLGEREPALVEDEASAKISSHSLIRGRVVAARLKANDDAEVFNAGLVSLQMGIRLAREGHRKEAIRARPSSNARLPT